MPVTPIRPEEVPNYQLSIFPSFVIGEWNKMIAENAGSSRSFDIKIGEATKRLKAAASLNMTDWNRAWLDVEKLYNQYGWDVSYDSPGYNEDYEGYYTFKAK